MAVVISVSFDDGGAGAAFDRLAAFGRDQSVMMGEIADSGRTTTMDRIARTKTDPDGRAWVKNKAGTPTLYASGDLWSKIGVRSDADSAEWGSPLPYAAVHQKGGVIKRTFRRGLSFTSGGTFSTTSTITIPARPFLGLGQPERAAITDIVGEGLVAALTPSGGRASA
jgi:phage gpG-like protein